MEELQLERLLVSAPQRVRPVKPDGAMLLVVECLHPGGDVFRRRDVRLRCERLRALTDRVEIEGGVGVAERREKNYRENPKRDSEMWEGLYAPTPPSIEPVGA